jgi:peptide/nickel transport system substrate-binding protein
MKGTFKRWYLVASLVLGTLVLACSGGEVVTTASKAQQQPSAPAQPAAAAPAADPAKPKAVEYAKSGLTASSTAAVVDQDAVKSGGVFITANRTDPPRGFDPARSGSSSLISVIAPNNGEGNFVTQCRDNVYEICPAKAESWEINADSTEFTFKVRDDIYWHDGNKLTVEDMKWWFDLWANGYKTTDAKGNEIKRLPGSSAKTLGPIEKTEVLDGNRFRITLKESKPLYLTFLGQARKQVAHPRHIMQPELDKGNMGVSPLNIDFLSAGPFKITEYRKGSHVTLAKNDLYYEKDAKGRALPYMDGIRFAIIKDAAAMDAAFRTGRLDSTAIGGGFELTKERKGNIEKTFGPDKVWFLSVPKGNTLNLAPNLLLEGSPWAKLKVRQAAHLWFDRDELVLAARGGMGEPASLFNPASVWGNSDLMTLPGYNPATKAADRKKAKELLAEAGYPNGFETKFMCRRQWVFQCEPIMGQLINMGLKVILEPEDDASLASRSDKGDFEIKLNGPGNVLPEDYVTSYSPRSEYAQSGNPHNDMKVKTLFDRLGKAKNLEERIVVAKEMEQYIAFDQIIAIQLYDIWGSHAYRTYVKGVPVPAVNPRILLARTYTWLDK